ncbi:hypothetical protein MMC20_002549 [Loxospora ochrophaea]|nr:hypothetical protein [Loxospora ochrophaea]
MEKHEDENGRSALSKAISTALIPVHAAVSKPAQRAYLGTFLFTATTLLLLCVSTIAYTLFYYNYVPQVALERTIHLQFCDGLPPHGTTTLSSSLTSLQPYDITLHLHLPRTPSNLLAGNFMLDLTLLPPTSPASTPTDLLPSSLFGTNTSTTPLARSRRPAILPYASPLVSTVSTLTNLPWYMVGWRHESETLSVPMFERISFAKGWKNIPDRVRVQVDADTTMQFYDVGVKIVARFSGLRYALLPPSLCLFPVPSSTKLTTLTHPTSYILHTYPLTSYLLFTTSFFTTSVLSTLLAYLLISSSSSTSKPSTSSPHTPTLTTRLSSLLKKEEDQDNDSKPNDPTSFPLHPSDHEEGGQGEGPGGSADDEDSLSTSPASEGGGVGSSSWRDSGLGTSLDEGEKGARRRSVARRRKALFGGAGRMNE